MNLQTFVALAEIVNAAAVTATLVVLVVSIRQNTKAQKVTAVQSLSAAIAAINVPAMQSPALGTALASATKDWHAASRDERILAHYFLFSYFKLIEMGWYQQKAGTLEPGQWLGWENVMLRFYHSPGVKSWWKYRGYAYSPAFQEYLAATRPPSGTEIFHDMFGDVEQERSSLR